MAYRIFCERLLNNEPIVVFGDGLQSRSNTYVSDCVDATIAALHREPDGSVFNIGGGQEVELLHAIDILAGHLGVVPVLEHRPARRGDQRRTCADTTRARKELGWEPTVLPEEGLRAEVSWVRSSLGLD